MDPLAEQDDLELGAGPACLTDHVGSCAPDRG